MILVLSFWIQTIWSYEVSIASDREVRIFDKKHTIGGDL